MIPGEVSSTPAASYSPLALACNPHRHNTIQAEYLHRQTGIYNTLIGLLLSIIDLGEPLAHAADCRHAGRRPQTCLVPR
jgi:hypothetical protein